MRYSCCTTGLLLFIWLLLPGNQRHEAEIRNAVRVHGRRVPCSRSDTAACIVRVPSCDVSVDPHLLWVSSKVVVDLCCHRDRKASAGNSGCTPYCRARPRETCRTLKSCDEWGCVDTVCQSCRYTVDFSGGYSAGVVKGDVSGLRLCLKHSSVSMQ